MQSTTAEATISKDYIKHNLIRLIYSISLGGPNNYVENPWTDGSKDAIINNTDIFRYKIIWVVIA